MLTISKKSDYGLLLTTALASSSSQTFIPISAVAREYKLPYKFLSQIALQLKDAGIIKSKEGFGGGYQLAKKPHTITIGQIITALEGELAPVSCQRGKRCRHHALCQHRFVMNKLRVAIKDTLTEYSLADLVTNRS